MTTVETPSSREVFWTGIGTTFDTPPASVDEALEAAGLDFTVDLFPMADWNPSDSEWVSIPERFSVRRRDTGAYLGNVSGRYRPLQNRDAFAFAGDIVQAGKGDIVAAWCRYGGAKVGLALQLDEVAILDDPVTPYMICVTSHDGRNAVSAHIALFQVVCYNQLPTISRSATTSWHAVHSQNVEVRMEQAHSALQLAEDYTARAVVEMARLGDMPVDENTGTKICRRAISKSATRMSPRKVNETTGSIIDIWRTTDTLSDRLRPTGYGLVHAVTEYWGHYRRYRTANAKANSLTSGIGKRCRDRVYRMLASPETALS